MESKFTSTLGDELASEFRAGEKFAARDFEHVFVHDSTCTVCCGVIGAVVFLSFLDNWNNFLPFYTVFYHFLPFYAVFSVFS